MPGEKLTIRYGCINCHQLEERGGYFSAILDDPTKGPPLITIEGAKGPGAMAAKLFEGAVADPSMAESPDADIFIDGRRNQHHHEIFSRNFEPEP